MNLKKIEFVGKLDALEDCLDFPDRNKFTETYQESDIVFPDLVFTLSQNSNKYVLPRAVFANGRLKVVGNNVFFRAAQAAGLKYMHFDLLLKDNQDAKVVFSKFGLRSPAKSEYEMPSTFQRFFFFDKKIQRLSAEAIHRYAEVISGIRIYDDEHCLQVDLRRENMPLSVAAQHYLLKVNTNDGNTLRSVEGIRRNGEFSTYYLTSNNTMQTQ